MFITLIHMDFHLEGCRSLKEKRSRMSGLRERFGKLPHIALCESGHQDEHSMARWSFIVIAVNRKGLDRWVTLIEEETEEIIDARVIRTEKEEL